MNHWRQLLNPLTPVVLLQVFVIVAGTVSTTIMLKANGYPDVYLMEWNAASVFVREWGWLGILIPVVWLSWVLWRAARLGYAEIVPRQVATGIALTILLAGFYCWATANPGKRRGIPLAPLEPETVESGSPAE